MKKALLLLLFVLVLSSSPCAADIDPSFEFSTLETEHFRIHYHQGLKWLAEQAARMAEEAHCLLTSAFGWSPSGKTHIVLIDNSDFANGSAVVLPQNIIYIQTVPPAGDRSIGQYHDWLQTLIIHEYAHVLSMDPAGGYSKVMRTIFGKPSGIYDPLSAVVFLAAAPPNVFMPWWWIEGIATWAESEFTPAGRGKGSYYEMIFRTAVAENNLPPIDRINGDVPYWPSGSMPYIWGLALNRYIAKEYGVKALRDLIASHSGRVPFFISRPPERTTGMNYTSLYWLMLNSLKEKQLEKINLLSQSPLTPYETLEIKGERLMNPRFSRDGTMLAVNKRDPHDHEGILILESGRVKSFVRSRPSDRNVTWGPKGRGIYFTQAELREGYNLYQDLYYHDIEKDKTRRLTENTRIKDPDLSPDGKVMALVKMETGKQELALLEIDKNEAALNILKEFEFMRVSGPRWSPDGTRIAFATKDNAGNTSLWLYSTVDGEFEELIKNGADNKHPTWSPDGNYIIFTSDKTGVFNLFSYSLSEKKLYQVTHLIGGAFQPDVSPDRKSIVFSSYGSRGFSIARVDYAPEAWREKIGPVIKIDWPEGEYNTPEAKCTTAPPVRSPEGSQNLDTGFRSQSVAFKEGSLAPAAPYSALRSALPRFWLPTLGFDHQGAVWGAFTAGGDVLGYHTYTVQAGIGRSGRDYYNATYAYNKYYPTLSLSAYKRPVQYSEPDMDEEHRGFVTSVSFPIRRLESNYSLQLGYHYKEHEWLDGPEWASSWRTDSLFASLVFDNTRRYPYSISEEEGRRISFTYRDYSRKRLSDFNSREYLGSYEEYIGLFRHNVIYLELKMGLSEGDPIPHQAFQIGGYPDSSVDFPLRGYPSGAFAGKGVLTGTLEYKRPIAYILSGKNTMPFFLDRLHIAAFADAGIAWNSSTDINWENVRPSIGVELRSDVVVGYKARITPTLGIARGLSKGGEDWIYITVYLGL
jgi:hypothetical protein